MLIWKAVAINLYIQRALAPAKISSMTVNEEEKKVDVYLQPDEVSLAIGKGGYNIKLASMLTGYQIDVYREMDEADNEDIYLDEFNDEIEQWVLDAFKAICCLYEKYSLTNLHKTKNYPYTQTYIRARTSLQNRYSPVPTTHLMTSSNHNEHHCV